MPRAGGHSKAHDPKAAATGRRSRSPPRRRRRCSTACPIRTQIPITSPASPCQNSPAFARSRASPISPILVIDYAPGRFLVESKSLKLYLNSYRNHGAFHEECTIAIGKTLVAMIQAKYLRIGGYWYPRGGMPIDVFWQAGKFRRASGCPTMASRPIAGAARFSGSYVSPAPAAAASARRSSRRRP